MVKISTVLFAVAATVPAHVSAHVPISVPTEVVQKAAAAVKETVNPETMENLVNDVKGSCGNNCERFTGAFQGCVSGAPTFLNRMYQKTPACSQLIPRQKWDTLMEALTAFAKNYPKTTRGGKIAAGVAGTAGVVYAVKKRGSLRATTNTTQSVSEQVAAVGTSAAQQQQQPQDPIDPQTIEQTTVVEG